MFDRFASFRARQTPHPTAVSMPGGDVSSAAFDLSIGRAAAAPAEQPKPALPAPGIATGYREDPDLTATRFRGGW